MKRKAFTLMEILLTICIIGIIGTILAKVIGGAMPDIYKARFLKAYNASKMIVHDMINDSSLYPDVDTSSPLYGFGNTEKPPRGIYSSDTFSGANKFPMIFADKLGVPSGNVSGGKFYSTRDNLEYEITGLGSYTITFYATIKDERVALGGLNVTQDGAVSCFSGRDYCGEKMTDLKRDFGED